MLEFNDRGANEPPSTVSFQSTHDDSTGEARASSADPAPAGASAASEAIGLDSGDAPKRRRRRGTRGGRNRKKRVPAAEGNDPAPATTSAVVGRTAAPQRETLDEELAGRPAGPSDHSEGDDRDGGGRKRRPRRRRKAASQAASQTEARAREEDDDGDEARDDARGDERHDAGGEQADAATDRKRRRRGSRGGRNRRKAAADGPLELESIPGEEDDLPELPDLPDDAESLRGDDAPASGGRKKRRRKKKAGSGRDRDDEDGKRSSRRASEGEEEPEVERHALILVNAADEDEQRVAVVERGSIVDFQMNVGHSKTFVNDIYRGRVVNLEPAIGAAFIDFGQGRNGFLHTSDVLSAYGEKDWSLDKLLTTTIDPELWDAESSQPPVAVELSEDGEEGEGGKEARDGNGKKGGGQRRGGEKGRQSRFRARPRLPISDLLKKGQMVVVQVTKDAIGDKGPTLTTYISIPGRYLVLMPSMTRTGVSRKIDDDKERRRLKRILESLDVPAGMGVIVRTAGVGRSKVDLKRDLDYLKGAWANFGKQLKRGNGPAALYRESDVAIRTIRDLFAPNTKEVIVDDPEVHKDLVEFTEKLMPEHVERIKLHDGPRPLFHTHGVEQDFERMFSRRIELPSGGSIVFDQTEALVAIDVNSGRTRSGGHDFEEIALKTNLEAAPEIARQIRLRDLGGILVCDFIDMMRQSNMRAVERAFKEALSTDRARSKIGRISQFGLLELTRQRLGPGLAKRLFHTCPRCRGSGRVRNVESRASAILRRLGSAMSLKGFSKVECRAHPEVVEYMKGHLSEHVRAIEYVHQREIEFLGVADQTEDSVLRYLRADGREVRPGGRRKR